MATVTSSIPAAMTAFVEGLQAREGLDKVQVSSAYLGADSGSHESIYLVGVSLAEQEWLMVGNRRREEKYTIDGVIWVMRAGKMESDVVVARERAFELLAEIEDYIRVDPTIGGTVKVGQIAAYPFQQGVLPEGRVAWIDFEIRCEKDLRSS